MSLLKRISQSLKRPHFIPEKDHPDHPESFLRRTREDAAGLSRFAKGRDRAAINADLKADEEPVAIPVPRPPVPRPRQTERAEPDLLDGLHFADRLRSGGFDLYGLPKGIQDIWRSVEFEFDFEKSYPDGYMYLGAEGVIRIQPHQKAIEEYWQGCTLHLIYHLALGYLAPPPDHPQPKLWQLAAEIVINQHISALPDYYRSRLPQKFPRSVANFFGRNPFGGSPMFRAGQPAQLASFEEILKQLTTPKLNLPQGWTSPAGTEVWDVSDISREAGRRYRLLYMLDQVKQFKPNNDRGKKYANGPIARAYKWVETSFPLLSAVTAAFTLDYENAERLNIMIGAVSAQTRTIYVNPHKNLSELEWRWVLVHEILHVVLEHHKRLQKRDPLLWNVACDYVINNWLQQMGVGMQPEGVLYKAEYAGLDAETIYDELLKNGGNDQVKVVSFRGAGMGDMLDFDDNFEAEPSNQPGGWRRSNLKDQMKQNAKQILEGDEDGSMGRGTLPAGLIEELNLGYLLGQSVQAPEWKTELGDWFNLRFAPKPPQRSYVRRSRRQSAIPDIPLAGRAVVDYHSPTFGVILDTSGSMSHDLLQRGLGAVVAYSVQHGVAFIRLVMCDTQPYDEGFVSVERLTRPYQIRGRGGTVLQPAVMLLQNVRDFPKDAPLLIVTDGAIDVLTIEREHAFLLPGDGRLPFEPRGPVFRILGEGRRSSFARPHSSPEVEEQEASGIRLRPPSTFGSSKGKG